MRTIVCFLLLTILSAKVNCGLILVHPGNGQQFVYSPVNVNATLHCEVNRTKLKWTVGVGNEQYVFADEDHRNVLHSRRIFQSGTVTSDSGVTVSNLIVFGNATTNNNTRICCQVFVGTSSEENCTTLVIYGRPSPPQQVYVKPTIVPNSFNISWTAITMVGVDQNYTIVFSSHQTASRETNYLIHNLGRLATECGAFLAYVKAVNGAGESDPSNNVTIPSLPDIEPVTASLTHQVWKSNGQIMVNVSFKPALYCMEYPVLTYNVTLTPLHMGAVVEVPLSGNQTEVMLGLEDGLRNNQKYVITVTAINAVGDVTSHGNQRNIFVTLEVQSVLVTLVDESTLDVRCLFISGSDAVGCYVVLISDPTKAESENVTVTLMRKPHDLYASGQINLTHKVHCNVRVFVFNIDVNNVTSNFSIERELAPNANFTCSDGVWSPLVGAVVLVTVIVIVIVIIIIVTATALFVSKVHNRGKQDSLSKSNPHTQSHMCLNTQVQSPPVQDKDCSPPCLVDIQLKVDNLSSSSLSDKQTTITDKDTGPIVMASSLIPVYAVPHKLKKDKSSNGLTHRVQRDIHTSTCEPSDNVDDQENTYHVLEDNKGQDTSSQTASMYTLPIKTGVKQSSEEKEHTLEIVSDDVNKPKDREEEHFYHVLEKKGTPNEDDTMPTESTDYAPEVSPSFDPKSSKFISDSAPVYQDISEIQSD